MGDSEESLVKAIHHYQSGLERYLQRQDETKMLHNLGRLKKLPIKVSHLEQTGVGRTVNSLRKLDGKVGDAAKSLVGKWKEMVMQEEDKKTEVSSADESPDETTEDIEENENASPKNNRRDHDEHRKKSSKDDSSKSKNDLKENRHQKKHKKRSHSSSDEDVDTPKTSDSDSNSNAENKKKVKVEKPKDRNSIETSKDNHKDSKDSKNKLKHVTNDNDSRKSKSDKHKRHETSDEKKHKHKSQQQDKKEATSNKTSKNHDSSKHEKEKEQKKKEHRDKDKHEKQKSKNKDKNEDKREKTSKPQASSSTSTSSKKDKNDVKSSKPVKNGWNGPECGTSFADALGMCEAPVLKKKKSASQPEKPREPSPMSDDNELSMPIPKEPLENLDINISTLLPPITPHYRPLGLPIEDQPRRILTDDEALSRVMMNKNQRTKVYSGNKVAWGKVPSLFDICVRVLQDNLDALEYTGGVPYSILKPILEKATANQLYMMEHHNPYLIEDSDELWKLHCQKEFRNKSREELETWRDMYMRCLDEREAKLRALTANIKQSQDKSLPVRTTKLAYVDSVAKPPRNIARKQAKNDTARPTPSSKLAALATKGEASKVAVPNPGARAAERSSSSNHAMKAKKAPLMAKTLSLFKNRFRR